jgi:hypothetical protein
MPHFDRLKGWSENVTGASPEHLAVWFHPMKDQRYLHRFYSS